MKEGVYLYSRGRREYTKIVHKGFYPERHGFIMRSFDIIVDSNCDLPPEYREEHNITIIPMPFELDGVPHDQGYWQEISGAEFYDALRHGGVAKTSQVNPDNFITIFTDYAKKGKDALFIVLSSGLSGTYNCARIALQDVKEGYPGCGIHVIDSLSASVGLGLLSMLAVQKREEGFTVAETAAWLEEKKHSCIGLFTVNDLMYLHRGGRLSKISAIAGSVLGIKPLLIIGPDGTLSLKDKARSRKAALEMLASQLKRSIASDTVLQTVWISHTDCLEDAQMLADMVKTAVSVREIVIMMTGPVIGAHLGPGALILKFEADMTHEEYENRFYR